MERVTVSATGVVEGHLLNVDLPLDGQDMEAYGPTLSKEFREKILAIAWAYAPVGLERNYRDVPVELQKIILGKALREEFSSREVGVKMYAAVSNLPVVFVRELLGFVTEAKNQEPWCLTPARF